MRTDDPIQGSSIKTACNSCSFESDSRFDACVLSSLRKARSSDCTTLIFLCLPFESFSSYPTLFRGPTSLMCSINYHTLLVTHFSPKTITASNSQSTVFCNCSSKCTYHNKNRFICGECPIDVLCNLH